MLIAGAVAAAAVLSNVVIVLSFLRVIRGLRREFARREDALIDKVCHLAGKPWNEAPASVSEPEPDEEELEEVDAPVWG